MTNSNNIYDLWKFTKEEQRELVGSDIGHEYTTIVVELDEWSARHFYNEEFAPLTIRQYENHFEILLHSIDDASVHMIWEIKKMCVRPDQAVAILNAWLERSTYFINLSGLQSFCNIFGTYHSNNN
jgi:hypothetical protein